MRLTRLLSILLASCAIPASASALDSALQEARLEEMAGDRQGAAHMLASWLDSNPGSPQAPVVMFRYLAEEQNLSSLLEVGKRFLQSARAGNALPETMARLARLFETAGKTEEARDAYLAAFARGAPVSALESAFLLSLEMNDMDALQSGLASIKDSETERVDFLRACVSFQKGDSGPANAELARIADSAADQSVVLRALWMSYQIAVRSGDPAARLLATRRLQAKFPQSPEYAIAAAEGATTARDSANVSLMALPGRFLSGSPSPEPPSSLPAPAGPSTVPPAAPTPAAATAAAATPAAAATTPAAAAATPAAAATTSAAVTAPAAEPSSAGAPAPPTSQKTLAVQAGSFQMKENADDLISELTKKGFSPTLRIDALEAGASSSQGSASGSQGKSLYRVFAGTGLAVDEARALLDKLHEAGFSGFLLNDR